MPETANTNLPVNDVLRHLTHELRQPLSALESIAFYLQMTLGGGGSDVSVQVNRLQQMVDSANWVLSDVLHLLQMAPPKPELLFNPLEANQLLTCRRIAENNGGCFSAEKDKFGWLCLRLAVPLAALA
jgi:signal transduction histidine kinase